MTALDQAKHDDQCEAEYVYEGYTDCGCVDRAKPVDLIETGALALQSLGEIARQNALLVYYRKARKHSRDKAMLAWIDDMELESLVIQQHLFRMLDDLLPTLIAEGADR